MYAYEMLWPVDCFGLMMRFSDVYHMQRDNESVGEYDGKIGTDKLRTFLDNALRELAIRASYWEGDITGDELYISSIPNSESSGSCYYIGMKQDHNGTSYIISEAPIVHLEEFLLTEMRGKPVSQEMQNSIKDILGKFAPINKNKYSHEIQNLIKYNKHTQAILGSAMSYIMRNPDKYDKNDPDFVGLCYAIENIEKAFPKLS